MLLLSNMEFKGKPARALIFIAMLAVVVAGCGSGGSSSSGASTSKPSSGGGETSAAFLKPGVESESPTFGKEADASEREAASKVLVENSTARAREDFATQCSSLTAAVIKEVDKEGVALSAGAGCANSLEAEAKLVPKSKLADNMTGPIDALRVEKGKGYALYHGKKDKDYEVPMALEGGQWKVGALLAKEIS
jgi:hypothetical protein